MKKIHFPLPSAISPFSIKVEGYSFAAMKEYDTSTSHADCEGSVCGVASQYYGSE